MLIPYSGSYRKTSNWALPRQKGGGPHDFDQNFSFFGDLKNKAQWRSIRDFTVFLLLQIYCANLSRSCSRCSCLVYFAYTSCCIINTYILQLLYIFMIQHCLTGSQTKGTEAHRTSQKCPAYVLTVFSIYKSFAASLVTRWLLGQNSEYLSFNLHREQTHYMLWQNLHDCRDLTVYRNFGVNPSY